MVFVHHEEIKAIIILVVRACNLRVGTRTRYLGDSLQRLAILGPLLLRKYNLIATEANRILTVIWRTLKTFDPVVKGERALIFLARLSQAQPKSF